MLMVREVSGTVNDPLCCIQRAIRISLAGPIVYFGGTRHRGSLRKGPLHPHRPLRRQHLTPLTGYHPRKHQGVTKSRARASGAMARERRSTSASILSWSSALQSRSPRAVERALLAGPVHLETTIRGLMIVGMMMGQQI